MTSPDADAGGGAAATAVPAAGVPAAAAGERCFMLFACCIAVRGARRSVVCDLQRQSWHLIPNGLYEILTERRGMTVAAIKDFYQHEFDPEIDGYFEFLGKHELGFFTAEPELFPPLALDFQTPSRITNAIIDVDAASDHEYATIFRQLDDLGCRAVEVRCFAPRRLAELRALLAPARAGRLRSIDLVLAHTPELDGEGLAELVAAETRLNSVTIHSAPAPRQATMGRAVEVCWLTQAIDSPACCGQVHPRLFTTNIDSFSEARRYNSCLNRKVAVDARGEIRNCPSLPRSYGNLRDTSLHAAVAQRDFAALWAINKDQIEVCKDCEFRYICTDCRAYLSDAQDRYSKPAKCGYDPYTAEWKPQPGKEKP
jgi:SPASM domain peptide maturase of grasp-with-spasm system